MGTQTFQLNRTNNIQTHSNVKIYKLNIDEDSQGLITIIYYIIIFKLIKNRNIQTDISREILKMG